MLLTVLLTCTVNLRESDFNAINSSIKKWLYADLFFKPEELVLFRKIKDGGLGLTSCKHKALAFLVKTFLDLTANPEYIESLFLNTLYRFYILNEDLPAPKIPPYFSLHFFNVIVEAINAGCNVIKMSVKQWYNFLIELDGTKVTGYSEQYCRVENHYPLTEWTNVWPNVRMSALSNACRSFAWKLAHDLLPTEARLNAVSKTSSNVCKFSCHGDPIGNLEHCFFECKMTRDIGSWLLNIYKTSNPNETPTSILRLDTTGNDELLFLAIKAFKFCWARRVVGKHATLTDYLSDSSVDLKTLEGTRHSVLSDRVKKLIRSTTEAL